MQNIQRFGQGCVIIGLFGLSLCLTAPVSFPLLIAVVVGGLMFIICDGKNIYRKIAACILALIHGGCAGTLTGIAMWNPLIDLVYNPEVAIMYMVSLGSLILVGIMLWSLSFITID